MKADTHPDYHEVTVVMTDGTEYKTRSTYGKEGDVIKLDTDPLSHPAWQGGAGQVVEKGQLDKFQNRYGSFVGDSARKGKEMDGPAKGINTLKAENKAEEAATEAAKEDATEAEATEEETKSED